MIPGCPVYIHVVDVVGKVFPESNDMSGHTLPDHQRTYRIGKARRMWVSNHNGTNRSDVWMRTLPTLSMQNPCTALDRLLQHAVITHSLTLLSYAVGSYCAELCLRWLHLTEVALGLLPNYQLAER